MVLLHSLFLQVIVGTFLIDSKKDVNTGVKVKAFAVLPPGCHHQVMNVGFRSIVGSSVRNLIRGNDLQQQAIRGSHFMIQGLHGFTDWRGGPDAKSTSAGAYEFDGYDIFEGTETSFCFAGSGGCAAQQHKMGDYDQIRDEALFLRFESCFRLRKTCILHNYISTLFVSLFCLQCAPYIRDDGL